MELVRGRRGRPSPPTGRGSSTSAVVGTASSDAGARHRSLLAELDLATGARRLVDLGRGRARRPQQRVDPRGRHRRAHHGVEPPPQGRPGAHPASPHRRLLAAPPARRRRGAHHLQQPPRRRRRRRATPCSTTSSAASGSTRRCSPPPTWVAPGPDSVASSATRPTTPHLRPYVQYSPARDGPHRPDRHGDPPVHEPDVHLPRVHRGGPGCTTPRARCSGRSARPCP